MLFIRYGLWLHDEHFEYLVEDSEIHLDLVKCQIAPKKANCLVIRVHGCRLNTKVLVLEEGTISASFDILKKPYRR